MSNNWNLAYVVPNATFRQPIENQWLALVPYSDNRFIELAGKHLAIKQLREKFVDQFGNSAKPSALLIRNNAPETVDLYAVLSFRNAIAISSLVDAWSMKLSGGTSAYPLWTDYFDFYRFTSTSEGKDLVGRSLAVFNYNSPTSFTGQTAPHLPNSSAVSFGVDQEVLDYLLYEWKRAFINKQTKRLTRVVLRSLEVAFQAGRMPAVGSQGTTIHDTGVSIGLWVSAFEILTHPKKGNANVKTVVECLGRVKLRSSKVMAKRYDFEYRNVTTRVNFVQHLYSSLYQARNDFMHGNSVRESNAYPFKNKSLPVLPACACLLYRIALDGMAEEKATSRSKNLQKELERLLASLLRNGPFQDALEKICVDSRK